MKNFSNTRSFQDVIDKGYKVVAYEDGMDDLINAAPGSAMEDVYKNHMLGPGYDDKYEAIRVVLNKYRGQIQPIVDKSL